MIHKEGQGCIFSTSLQRVNIKQIQVQHDSGGREKACWKFDIWHPQS